MDFGRASTLLETLQETLNLGIALEKVLPMFTSNVANLLRLKAKGNIASNFDADLVVLNEKFEITDVMANGVWHKRNNQSVIRGTFE